MCGSDRDGGLETLHCWSGWCGFFGFFLMEPVPSLSEVLSVERPGGFLL